MNVTIRKLIQGTALPLYGSFGLLLLTSTAHARTDELPTLTIRYADLDLNKPAGAQVLYRRIHNAAEQVCGNVDSRDPGIRARRDVCVTRAVTEAVERVGATLLTALHSTSPLRLAGR